VCCDEAFPFSFFIFPPAIVASKQAEWCRRKKNGLVRWAVIEGKKTAAAARVVCLFLKIFNKKAIFKTII
jgi:hypothetical protein